MARREWEYCGFQRHDVSQISDDRIGFYGYTSCLKGYIFMILKPIYFELVIDPLIALLPRRYQRPAELEVNSEFKSGIRTCTLDFHGVVAHALVR
jgi:hypothetical protein